MRSFRSEIDNLPIDVLPEVITVEQLWPESRSGEKKMVLQAIESMISAASTFPETE